MLNHIKTLLRNTIYFEVLVVKKDDNKLGYVQYIIYLSLNVISTLNNSMNFIAQTQQP